MTECFEIETGRREVPGSIPGRACRPSRSEITVVFSKIRLNTGKDPLERPPMEGTSPTGPCPTSGQSALTLQPTNPFILYQYLHPLAI